MLKVAKIIILSVYLTVSVYNTYVNNFAPIWTVCPCYGEPMINANMLRVFMQSM